MLQQLIFNNIQYFPIRYNQTQMSSQHFKKLKIKTSILKRLRKEYETYQKETISIQEKINKYEIDLAIVQKDEELEIGIRKNREFLMESQTVLMNVKQKLIESFEALALFLSEKGEDESITGTAEKNEAENLVLQVETFLENIE